MTQEPTPAPDWWRLGLEPAVIAVLKDLYSRIEELERLQRVKVSRPSLPPPPTPRTRTMGELLYPSKPLPRSE